jgi:hypothetical protein
MIVPNKVLSGKARLAALLCAVRCDRRTSRPLGELIDKSVKEDELNFSRCTGRQKMRPRSDAATNGDRWRA